MFKNREFCRGKLIQHRHTQGRNVILNIFSDFWPPHIWYFKDTNFLRFFFDIFSATSESSYLRNRTFEVNRKILIKYRKVRNDSYWFTAKRAKCQRFELAESIWKPSLLSIERLAIGWFFVSKYKKTKRGKHWTHIVLLVKFFCMVYSHNTIPQQQTQHHFYRHVF